MDIKVWLGQVKFLDTRLMEKLNQLNVLRELAQVADLDCIAEKMSSLENEINRDIVDLLDLKKEILQVIRQVPDPEYQTVLELRYLSGWSWEKVAVNMGYCKSHVRDLNNRALMECEHILEKKARKSAFQ